MKVDQVLSNPQLLQRSGTSEALSQLDKTKPKLQAMNDEASLKRDGSGEDMTRDRAEELVEGMNEFLEPAETSIRYEMHDKLDRNYISIVDKETDEVVKEIPPEKMLDVYAAMAEFMGFIVDERI
ncbi:flagellar protein FlaG [Alkalibacillus almallahensis]|uniref:flagellar protein FlaG n=1 Tax=Alkalibacillus almallahensis TaxID=1379154 RepID=UPI001420BC27|nr:flagellar protein FlaG [Alkalibacillus almallahensis]NIK12508.1 flagellar protein FlaG [Alkalibacillus almallahensis]